MRYICSLFVLLWFFCLAYPQFSFSQTSISQQEEQSQTISAGAIIVDCADSLLPFDKGTVLDEPSLFTVRGEMDESLRSSHPARIALQPESGASDDLTSISGCSHDGAMIWLRVEDAGETITVRDSASGNTGTIQLLDDVDIVLDDERKVVVFGLFGGAWSAIASGASGSSGGNIVFVSGQKLDLSQQGAQDANEGLIVNPVTSCAAAITSGQMCYDSDDNQLCFGTGSSIVCIGGVQCTDSVDCFINAITDIGNFPLTVLDSNNDGFVFDIAAGGPRLRCMTDYGGAGEAECTPSEIKSFAFISGVADGTECIRVFDQAINDETIPVGFYCIDNDAGAGGTVRFHIPMPDRWDGTTLEITAHMHSNEEATPSGDLNFDWVGYCSEHSVGIGTSNYPAATANSEMIIDLDSISTDEGASGTTVGDIPLSGCTSANAKFLHLEMTMDESSSTADNWSDHIFIGFIAKYGSKAYSDE